MEDTATAILFSDDLAYFLISEELDLQHFPPDDDVVITAGKSRFRDFMGIAVTTLMKAADEDIDLCYQELVNEQSRILDDEYICFLALEAAPSYFPEGYTSVHFLSYCAMVMGVCLKLCRLRGSEYAVELMDSGASAVSTVLIGFMLTNDFQKEGGWLSFEDVCLQFNRRYMKKAKRVTKK